MVGAPSVADLAIELSEIPAFPLDRRLGLVLFLKLRGHPFLPNCPEGVLELFVFLSLGLAYCDWILTLIEQLFRVVALFARGLEPDAGKGAKRHILALAAETVAEEPQLGPIGPNHDAEALAVGNRVFLVRRRRITDFRIAQFIHGKGSLAIGRPSSVPGPSSVPTVYPKSPDALGR